MVPYAVIHPSSKLHLTPIVNLLYKIFMEEPSLQRRQLSSSATTFSYRASSFMSIFPVTGFCWMLVGAHRSFPAAVLFFAAAFALFWPASQLRDVALQGNHFLIRHGKREEIIPLSDLEWARGGAYLFGDAITLALKSGRKVHFAAQMRPFPWGEHYLAKEIRDIQEKANRGSVNKDS